MKKMKKNLLLIISIIISSLFYSQVTSGLILHFNTKDVNSYPGSGTVINDLSGNNRHSEIIGGVNYSNNQIVLDGTDNYIKTPALPGISSNNQSFSFELVVTPSSTSGNVLSMSNSSNHGGWNMPPIGSANSKFFAEIYSNNELVYPFNLGQKYHLVLVWDDVNNKQQFYVDGQLVAEQSNISYNGSNGNNYIFLGENNPGCCHSFEGVNSGDFAGNYELFRVYSSALSASEVLGNYNSATCSITVDAGADKTVCVGNQITLNAPETDLFISEYAEGSSNNKYIEIFNGTGADVDLSNYELWKIGNGGSWPENIFGLSGTLLTGEVYVIYNNLSDATIVSAGDVTWTQADFNGDDAIGLAKSINGTMTLIDAVGTDGADPGTGWSVAGVNNATKDHTLVRKSNVTRPNTNWTASSGTNTTDSEWVVLAKDDWTNIGVHSSVLPITYTWDNGITDGTAFTPTATATYTVTGTDAYGCIATDAVDVTVNALPTVDAGADITIR